MAGNRILLLDALRGIAAWMVVFQHVVEDASGKFKQVGENVLNFGISGVVLFFLISGFVIPVAWERGFLFWSYMRSRALRILPAYWVVLVGIGALAMIGALPEVDRYFSDPLVLGANAFLVNEYVGYPFILGVSWTLSVEIAWYILFGLYMVGPRRFGLSPVSFVGLSILGLLGLAMVSIVADVRLPLGRIGLVLSAIYGFSCYEVRSGRIGRVHFLMVSLSIAAVLSFAFYTAFGFHEHQVMSLLVVSLSWGLAYALFGAFLIGENFLNSMMPSFFYTLGSISYSTYLIHPVVRDVLFRLEVDRLYLVPIVFLVVYALSRLMFESVEKPIIRYYRKLAG